MCPTSENCQRSKTLQTCTWNHPRGRRPWNRMGKSILLDREFSQLSFGAGFMKIRQKLRELEHFLSGMSFFNFAGFWHLQWSLDFRLQRPVQRAARPPQRHYRASQHRHGHMGHRKGAQAEVCRWHPQGHQEGRNQQHPAEAWRTAEDVCNAGLLLPSRTFWSPKLSEKCVGHPFKIVSASALRPEAVRLKIKGISGHFCQ